MYSSFKKQPSFVEGCFLLRYQLSNFFAKIIRQSPTEINFHHQEKVKLRKFSWYNFITN